MQPDRHNIKFGQTKFVEVEPAPPIHHVGFDAF